MLNLKNTVVTNVTVSGGAGGEMGGLSDQLNTAAGRLKRFKGLMDLKAAAYLRLCATKNSINRAVDYHYLCQAVTDSTAPVQDFDYIHPVVLPAVQYATAVVTKGLSPNGSIDFEFVPDGAEDHDASEQATNMVSAVLNQMNNAHRWLHQWVQDSMMHKNGMMMVQPIREPITLYREIKGTDDQLRAFEIQAEESGLKATRQSKKRDTVDFERVKQMLPEITGQLQGENQDQLHQQAIDHIQANMDTDSEVDLMPGQDELQQQSANAEQSALDQAIAANTTYTAKYKLTGTNFKLRLRQVAQHYWICDPNTSDIQDQPFCGFYDPMTIQEATEIYPGIKLDEFRQYAEYNQNGAFQAGSVLNNLAIHGRDSVPTMGIPVNSAASADPDSRQITILTAWDRFDIDGDGELELVEIVYSGSYIITAREVEYIPMAMMNPKPLPGNFFGMSIGESVIPMQEYMTAQHRAEIMMGLLQSTTRTGVKPDKVDFEMMMDNEAAIFVLDSKFDPNTDVWSMPIPQGNIGFIDQAMNRMQQDVSNIIGMVQPTDVFNPEIMSPGNSGIKLQTALTPAQLVQDDTVKNAGEGLKDLIWLIWRTLVEYRDDFGVKKLAGRSGEGQKEFLDGQTFDDLNFCERKNIRVSLALGMMSDENKMVRIEAIKAAQTELYQKVSSMTMNGTLTPEMWVKIRRPYEETLETLGIREPDAYLPTDDEVKAMIQQGQEAAKGKEPSADDKAKLSTAELNKAKTKEIEMNLDGTSAERQLEYLQVASGHSAAGIA